MFDPSSIIVGLEIGTSKVCAVVGELSADGIKVHKLKGLKLHAKLLFADGVRAIIGSINLAPGSFDSRRELAIEVRDQEVMDRLHNVVHRDWKNSRPLDLTDDGLMAELEDRDDNVVEDLALDTGAGE